MNRLSVAAVLSVIGCASAPAPAPTTTPQNRSATTSESALNVYARIPSQIGAFKLTERTTVEGLPADSVFRFSDGSKTNLSVVVYEAVVEGVIDTDPQKWTALEGEKFKEVQAIRRQRGRIDSYVLAFSDTTRFTAGGRSLLEHAIGMPTRYPNGAITVEMQYLYLIDNKFVKVRGTIPEQGWQQTRVPSFARELARRMASRN